jgi:hypothetical protein
VQHGSPPQPAGPLRACRGAQEPEENTPLTSRPLPRLGKARARCHRSPAPWAAATFQRRAQGAHRRSPCDKRPKRSSPAHRALATDPSRSPHGFELLDVHGCCCCRWKPREKGSVSRRGTARRGPGARAPRGKPRPAGSRAGGEPTRGAAAARRAVQGSRVRGGAPRESRTVCAARAAQGSGSVWCHFCL